MKTKQNFNVLDCTLRDGGYYNKWNFSNSFVRNYLATQNKISTDIIEIDFRKLSKNEKTFNEEIEDNEILRFLDLGYKVKMVKMSNDSISIDTKSDLKKVKLKLFK